MTDTVSNRGPRFVWLAVAVLCAAHFTWLATYHAPAISTPDANSYFAQARRIALEGTTGFGLESPAQFTGPHWSSGADDYYYCTHPPGLALLLAVPYAVADYRAATWVIPLLASLSLIGVFLLCRLWVGERWALLSAALLAVTPFANEHALFGDSHVAVQFLLLAALICLVRWKSTRAAPWAFAAGVLAGTIPTLRYPELLYPLALGVFVVAVARRERATRRSAVAMALGAILPLGFLLLRNHMAYGSVWSTGYMATQEQCAFSFASLARNGPGYVLKLLTEGCGPLFPLGVAGIVVMIRRGEMRRVGLFLTSLIAPVTLLYMSWYWEPDRQSMRFLLPTFPLYTVAGVWLLAQLMRGRRAALGLAVVLWALTAAWGLPASHMAMRHLERDNGCLADITATIERHVPRESVVIAGMGVQQHLDFVGYWKLADSELLALPARQRTARKLANRGPQSRRRPLADLPAEARGDAFTRAVWEWAGEHGRVFLLAKSRQRDEWQREFFPEAQFSELARIELPRSSFPAPRQPDRVASPPNSPALIRMRSLISYWMAIHYSCSSGQGEEHARLSSGTKVRY